MRLGTGLFIDRQTALGAGAAPVPVPELMALITGQSNGSPSSTTALTTTPSDRHSRFTFGIRSRATDTLGPLVGLYEQDDDTGAGSGETMASAFAAMYDKLSGGAGPRWLVTDHAIPSQAIAGIRKGGTATAYVDGQAQVTAAVAAAPGIVVPCVLVVHGETDTQNNNGGYPASYTTFQSDYDGDVKAKTSQGEEVVLYASQNTAYPPGSTSATGATKTGSCQLTYLDKAVNSPAEFACVGPTAISWLRDDSLHWINGFIQVIGCYFAKTVFKKRNAQDALPLYPTAAVALTATTTEVTFHVPVPPLVWRLDLFQPTTTGNTGGLLGFRCYDDSGSPPAVSDVQITAADKVVVTHAAFSGSNKEIRIGFSTSQTSNTGGTPLADSDPLTTPSSLAVGDWPLPNFCCSSYVPITG